MVQLARFQKLVADYAPTADFLFIYIKEAHPSDGWSFTNNRYNFKQHKNIADRLVAAQIVEEQCPSCPVLLDSMKNEACAAYKAFPERLYILKDEKVVLQGGEGPMDYSVSEIEEWLKKYKESTTDDNNNNDDNNNTVESKGDGFLSRVEDKETVLEGTSI